MKKWNKQLENSYCIDRGNQHKQGAQEKKYDCCKEISIYEEENNSMIF